MSLGRIPKYQIWFCSTAFACDRARCSGLSATIAHGPNVRSGLVAAHHNMQVRKLWEEYDASAPELRQRIADKINKRDPMCGP